jgi:hypothetical protein
MRLNYYFPSYLNDAKMPQSLEGATTLVLDLAPPKAVTGGRGAIRFPLSRARENSWPSSGVEMASLLSGMIGEP